MSDVELRFKISAYTPDSIPLARLGQYVADLGAMLGEPSEVHFARLEQGSTVIVHRVKAEALPKVVERTQHPGWSAISLSRRSSESYELRVSSVRPLLSSTRKMLDAMATLSLVGSLP
jgi:hypothetical protein